MRGAAGEVRGVLEASLETCSGRASGKLLESPDERKRAIELLYDSIGAVQPSKAHALRERKRILLEAGPRSSWDQVARSDAVAFSRVCSNQLLQAVDQIRGGIGELTKPLQSYVEMLTASHAESTDGEGDEDGGSHEEVDGEDGVDEPASEEGSEEANDDVSDGTDARPSRVRFEGDESDDALDEMLEFDGSLHSSDDEDDEDEEMTWGDGLVEEGSDEEDRRMARQLALYRAMNNADE